MSELDSEEKKVTEKMIRGIVNKKMRSHPYLVDLKKEDCVQACWENIEEGRSRFKGNSKLSTYNYQIANNVMFDIIEKEEKRYNKKMGSNTATVVDDIFGDCSSLYEHDQWELMTDMQKLLKHEEYNDLWYVFGLRYNNDKVVEIAEKMNLSIEQVRRRLAIIKPVVNDYLGV